MPKSSYFGGSQVCLLLEMTGSTVWAEWGKFVCFSGGSFLFTGTEGYLGCDGNTTVGIPDGDGVMASSGISVSKRGKNNGLFLEVFKGWRLLWRRSQSSWCMMQVCGVLCWATTTAGSQVLRRRCRTKSSGFNGANGRPVFRSNMDLYCFWRSLSVAALPEVSTGCGLNNAALVGDFYWSQRFIANWLGEYFRPAICVFWCSSSTIYESLPECSAFLISCLMIFTHCSASPFYVRSGACRHDRDSLFPHEIQEHTMVKWLIVCIYQLWNLMTWSDALDMCYDTFRSFIFKSCQFWVRYFEQQSTATRKSCHPVVIMSMVTCKKYKKYRQWDRLHLNYLSVLGTLSYITVSA